MAILVVPADDNWITCIIMACNDILLDTILYLSQKKKETPLRKVV